MTRLASTALRASFFLGSALVAACSGADGGDGAKTEESAALRICPNGNCGGALAPPAPTFPAPIGCISGTTCTLSPTSLAAPLSVCTAPQWSTQAFWGVSSDWMVMDCATGGLGAALVNAWVAQNAAYQAAQSTTFIDLPNAVSGTTYVYFLPPTPTAPPGVSSNGEDCGSVGCMSIATANSFLVNPSGDYLPCTPRYIESTRQRVGTDSIWDTSWVAYCVDSADVDTWVSTNGGGTSTDPYSLPAAPYGYTYVYDNETSVGSDGSGGSCPVGCAGTIGIGGLKP